MLVQHEEHRVGLEGWCVGGGGGGNNVRLNLIHTGANGELSSV